MEEQTNGFTDGDNPRKLASELIIGKNHWLIKCRWWYTFFVAIFFWLYKYFGEALYREYRDIALIVFMLVLGNLIFIFALRRHTRHLSGEDNGEPLFKLASLQLDFDLVALSLLVYFSGGFESPLNVLYIFFVMISTFLIYHEKAFRSTVTAMVLVVVIFFSQKGVEVSSAKVTSLVAFIVIIFFSYLVAAYLSQNLKDNEEKLQQLLKKFRELSVTDGLTNLYNQTHFFLLLNLQFERARRYNSTFSVIIFDVDNFKNYNDNNGHIQGSDTLRRIGALMKDVFRSSDILAKYGGDEFVILLPNSDKVGAFLGAERLRETVENEAFPGRELQPMGKVTVSLGVGSFPEHGNNTEELLDKADKALYAAKNSGRNKTVIYSEDMEDD